MIRITYLYLKVMILAIFILILFPLNHLRAQGLALPQPPFLESPFPTTAFSANFEIVPLEDPLDGAFIFNAYRVDLGLLENLVGLYARFPFSGVVNLDFGGGEDIDDYDFGNIALGGKFVLVRLESALITPGFEVLIPTGADEDSEGILGGILYFRDLPSFIPDAVTLYPYLTLGLGAGMVGFQGNFGVEIITNADESGFLEDDETEVRLKYGAMGSLTPAFIPVTTSFFVEFQGVSTTTFEDDVTEIFLTPGVRIGRLVNVGAGVQFPLGEDVDDIANANFFIDLRLTLAQGL